MLRTNWALKEVDDEFCCTSVFTLHGETFIIRVACDFGSLPQINTAFAISFFAWVNSGISGGKGWLWGRQDCGCANSASRWELSSNQKID